MARMARIERTPRRFSGHSASRARNRQQAFLLLLLGLLFLAAAWFWRLNPYTYPLGVLLFGAGMLLACALNRDHLASASFLTTMFGLAVFLVFKHVIPGNQVLAIYLLAAGVALFGIAQMARRGYVGKGALSPSLLVILVGLLEYLLAVGAMPSWFVPFMLSLWLPTIGLLALGLLYLLASLRV